MASINLERLLASFNASAGFELDLKSVRLTESDWAALSAEVDGLRTVASLRVDPQAVPGSVVIQFASLLPNLCHLKVTAFRDNDLGIIAEKLPTLTTLDLSGCEQVTDAGLKAVADNLNSLTTLDLTSCRMVTDAGVKAVTGKLTALTSLNLNRCEQVTDDGVKAIASKLTALIYLNLSGCRRVTDVGVKAVADKLAALTSLDLSECVRVTDSGVKAVADKLTALNLLNLYECHQVTVAAVKAIANKLNALTSLNLSECGQVTDEGVKAVAVKLTALTSLNLSGCGQVSDAAVKTIADKLTALTYLNLYRCYKVTDDGVKAIAKKLTALTYLDLSDCRQVTDDGVKAIAKKLTALTSLNLYTCDKVTDDGVKAIANKLTALTSLNLYKCGQVTDAGVMAIAKKLTALTSLNLYLCGQVTDIGVMAVANKLPALTSLNLSGCRQVTDAGVMAVAEKLTALTSLNLSGCRQVTDAGMMAVANKLPALTSLNLSGCRQVTDAGVMAVAVQLVSLFYLDVKFIPSLRAPQELLENPNDPVAIRAFYLRGGSEGTQQLNEAKLIVVGNEAVGKSALVNFLVDGTPCSDSGKTNGVNILDRINVAKWNVEQTDAGGDLLRLNVWDFGGQEVLYETHKFFLTARSLYIVVLEARRENTTDAELELHNWMRAVRNRGGEEVPVVVVVNKAEAPHNLRLDEPRLRKEYPAIRAFVSTSCRNPAKFFEGGKGIAGLRKLIVDLVRTDEALRHVRDWFPLSYFNVKEEVGHLAREESMLTTAQYTTICNAAGITKESEQDSLLALLDAIGVVVRHSETTLLDPNWLTTAVYRVLTHADVVKSGGEYSRNELGQLLADLQSADRYPSKWWPYIADMMVRFGLSFELPGQSGRYLVPLQLPTQEPEVNWEERDCLRFRYNYDSLPMGLIPRLIVEMHRHLTPKRTAWISGVVLDIDGCRILVRADRKNRRVLVFVSGPQAQRRGALTVVRTAFATVHALHSDLTIQSMVPVDVASNPDAAIDYETLLTAEQQGIKFHPVPGAPKPFSVKELLEGVGRMSYVRSHARRKGLIQRSWDTVAEPMSPQHSGFDSPRPQPKPWWFTLIGPAVAAVVTTVLTGMYLLGANPLVTVLLAIAAGVFAVVYFVQARFAWRSSNWPKIHIHLCVATAVALAMLPSLKLIFDLTGLGKLEFALDQGPIAGVFFLLAAVAFAGFQVYRERHGLHEHG